MSNQDDPLTRLWQSQPVQSIDTEELKAMWQKNRHRQWWWAATELSFGLFAIVFCLYILFTDDNLFLRIWVGFFAVFACVVTPMTIRLRYKSLKGNVPTSQYVQLLIEQKRNNIKLMRLTAWT